PPLLAAFPYTTLFRSQPRIDLAPEPDEALHRVDLFVRLRGLVTHAVVDVVDRCFGTPVIRHLRAAGERDVRAVVRVVRIHPALRSEEHTSELQSLAYL